MESKTLPQSVRVSGRMKIAQHLSAGIMVVIDETVRLGGRLKGARINSLVPISTVRFTDCGGSSLRNPSTQSAGLFSFVR